jgi:hypothetical protein
VRRLHSSGIAFALLTVFTSGPAVATACAMVCAPALHEHPAAEQQGAAACHHASATRPIVAAAPDDHDCRTHLGAVRDVLATLTPMRHGLDPRYAPGIVPAGPRVVPSTQVRGPASHGPPPGRVLPQPAPLVLRI